MGHAVCQPHVSAVCVLSSTDPKIQGHTGFAEGTQWDLEKQQHFAVTFLPQKGGCCAYSIAWASV